MEKWIIAFVIITLLILSFYLLEKTEKYERHEPTSEELKAENYAYCLEGCDWDGECVEREC